MATKLDPFEHVVDSNHVEFFDSAHLALHLPTREDLPGFLQPLFPFGLTKFLILEFLAAGLLLAVFLPLAKSIRDGGVPRGRLWNGLELLLTFVRDQIARPAIGEHDYKKYLPFLWTTFLFIIVLNLFGMIPFSASATASLAVTIPLALVSFCVIHWSGIKANHGVGHYLKTFIPPIEGDDPVLRFLKPFIAVGMFFLEIASAVIRGAVLAIRLFANMLAGHTVLFVILVFIRMAGNAAATGSEAADVLFWPITAASVGLSALLSILELFVACLQAFVFTFLTAIFIGQAMHPSH